MKVWLLAIAVLGVVAFVALVLCNARPRYKHIQSADPAASPNLEEIKRLAHSGRKIDAIKMYRELYRVGLKEAKDAVEELVR
jgi:ribosomal protein L7/L12